MAILTTCTLTFTDLNDIFVGPKPPENPVHNQLWLCTKDEIIEQDELTFKQGDSSFEIDYNDESGEAEDLSTDDEFYYFTAGDEYKPNTIYKYNAYTQTWISTNEYDSDIEGLIENANSQIRNLLLGTFDALEFRSSSVETTWDQLRYLLINGKDTFNNDIYLHKVTFAFDWRYIGTDSPNGSIIAVTNGETPTYLSEKIFISPDNDFGTSVFTYEFKNLLTDDDMTNDNDDVSFDAISFITKTTGKIQIDKARLYIGTKDVGYNPAPEDAEQKFTTIFERTDKGIYMSHSDGNTTGLVDINNKEIKIAAPYITMEGYTTINEHFKVLPNGDIEAVNAKISGSIILDNNSVVPDSALSNNVSSTINNTAKLSTGLNKWLFEKFDRDSSLNNDPATLEHIMNQTPKQILLIDEMKSMTTQYGNNFIGKLSTNAYFIEDKDWTTTARSDDGSSLYLNGKLIASIKSNVNTSVTLNFKKGWNNIVWIFNENTGDEGAFFNPLLSTAGATIINAYSQTNIDLFSPLLDTNIKANTTRLEATEGQIQTLIADTTVEQESGNITLKEAYSSLKQTVDGINSTIGTTEASVKNSVKEIITEYYLSTSQTSLSGGTWSATAPQWEKDKYMWIRNKTIYIDANKRPTYSNASCIAGAKGEDGIIGKDGIGITKTEILYYVSNSDTIQNGGSWSTIYPSYESNKEKYLWIKTRVYYDNNTTKDTEPYRETNWDVLKTTDTKIANFEQTIEGFRTTVSETKTTADNASKKSDDTAKSFEELNKTTSEQLSNFEQTIEGFRTTVSSTETSVKNTVKNIVAEYYLSTSNTSLAGGSWSATAPQWVNGKYMWIRYKTTYIDETKNATYSSASCIAGAKGDTGIQGESGNDGISITKVELIYYVSTSSTNQIGGNWSTTYPSYESNKDKYLWVANRIYYSNNTTKDTTPYRETNWDTLKTTSTKLTEFKNTIDGFSTTVSEAYDLATNANSDSSIALEKSSNVEQTVNNLTANFTDGNKTGITQIGIDGITVKQNNANAYTQMSNDKFVINKNNEDIFKVDTNGLYLKGKVEIESGSIVPDDALSTNVNTAVNNTTKLSNGLNKWLFEIFDRGTITGNAAVGLETITNKTPKQILLIDEMTKTVSQYGDNFIGKLSTNVYFGADKAWTTTARSDDGSTLYLNGVQIATMASGVNTNVTFNFKKGWNNIIWIFNENTGNEGAFFNPLLSTAGAEITNAYNQTDTNAIIPLLDNNIKSNTTRITANEEGIKTLIANTTVNIDGDNVTIKDAYSSLNQTVNGISSSVGSIETSVNNTVKSITTEYYLSTSQTSLTGGSWSTTAPTWVNGKYMWIRNKTTYTDSSKSATYSAASCIAGAKGDTGAQGIQGEKGEDGTSVKILGSYATKAELDKAHPSNNANGDGYIINGDLYVWTNTEFLNVGRIKGETGESAYLHIKYSDNGANFTNNNGETVGAYIGTYTDNVQQDSSNFNDYTWTKIKGDTGAQGVSITKTELWYYVSTSNTAQSGGSWSTTYPSFDSNNTKHLWVKTRVYLSNNTTKDTTPYLETNWNTLKTTNSKIVSFQETIDGFETEVNEAKATANSAEKKTTQVIADVDNITSRVSNVESSYNNLQIGGRNLLEKYVRAGKCCTVLDDGALKIGTEIGDTYFFLRAYDDIEQGETCTLSCTASNVPEECNWSFGVTAQASNFQIYINKNGRCFGTGTITNKITKGTSFLVDDLNNQPTTTLNIILSDFKLERGNKATDYTPAPEDINESINGLTTRVQTAESKLTKNSLTTTIGNYYTTSSDVESKITSKGYATTSQVQQTVDGFEAKFKESGGYNLLRNSCFSSGTDYWSVTSTSCVTIDTSRTYNNHNSVKISTEGKTSNGWTGLAQTFVNNIPIGTTCRTTLYYYVEDKTTFDSDFALELKGKKTGATSEVAAGSISISKDNIVQGAWTKLTNYLTTDCAWDYLYVYPWVKKNGTIWITDIMVTRGQLEVPWSPHPYEVYDGITKITKDGIKVSQSNINGYTNMTASGFYINKGGEDIFKVDSNGLYLKGKMTITDGSTVPDSALSSTITSGAAAGTSANNKINNLSIGGRNLVKGTSEDTLTLGGYPSSSYSEGKGLNMTIAASESEYILSFEAYSTVDKDRINQYFYSPNTTTSAKSSTGQSTTNSNGICEVTLTTEWKKYWVKWTQTATTLNKSIIVGRRMAGTGSGTVYVRRIKLEAGNQVTNWTPAPEDVAGDISAVKTTADAAKSTLDSNKTNWTNAYNRAVEWANGSVSGSVEINGGKIAANTIVTNKLAVGDFNNYCDLVKGQNLVSKYGTATWMQSTTDATHTYWKCVNNYLPLSQDYINNPFNSGDELVFEFQSYTASKRNLEVGVWFYNAAKGNTISAIAAFESKAEWDTKTVSITLPTDTKVYPYCCILIRNVGYTNGEEATRVEVRNVKILRKLKGNLIVDGTITADKIASNTITADKMMLGDTTNLCRINENTFTNGNTVIAKASGGYNMFRIGNESTAGWYAIEFNRFTKDTQIKYGSYYTFSFEAFGTGNIIGSSTSRVAIRCYYTDGTYTNLRSVNFSPTATRTRYNLQLQITENIDTSKTVAYIRFFCEIQSKTGYLYLRDIHITKNADITTIAPGSITTGMITTDGLSAGVIKSGTIDADRIGANSITASKIAAHAITTDKIAVGDFNNYFTLNSTNCASYGWEAVFANGDTAQTMITGSKIARDNSINDMIACRPNDKLLIRGYMWHNVTKDGNRISTGLMITQYNIKKEVISYDKIHHVSIGDNGYDNEFTLMNNCYYFSVWIQCEGLPPFDGAIYINDTFEVKKKLTGELIVDGSITANKLAINNTDSYKMVENLIPNGKPRMDSFYGNVANWQIENNCWLYKGDYPYHMGIANQTSSEGRVTTDLIEVDPGWYSLSLSYVIESNVSSADVYVIGSYSKSGGYDWIRECAGGDTNHDWHEIHDSFQVPNGIKYLSVKIDNNGANGVSSSYVVFVDWVMLNRGRELYPGYSDYKYKNSIINNNTTIDSTGIKVTHNNGCATTITASGLRTTHSDGSYTQINAGGLELYQGSTGYKYKALFVREQISVYGNGFQYIKLPAQFNIIQNYNELSITYMCRPVSSFKYSDGTVGSVTSGAYFHAEASTMSIYINESNKSAYKDSEGYWYIPCYFASQEISVMSSPTSQQGKILDTHMWVQYLVMA